MKGWPLEPMKFGVVLDRSFHLYRSQFILLFILSLILFGPFVLIFIVALFTSIEIPFLPHFGSFQTTLAWFQQYFQGNPSDAKVTSIIVWLILAFISLLLVILVSIPIYMASIVFMVESIKDGITPKLGDIVKRAWKRLGPLTGNTILFGLIQYAVQFAITYGISLIGIIVVGIVGVSTNKLALGNVANSLYFGIALVIAELIVVFIIMIVNSYASIRFGYFLPPVALKKNGVGLGSSWNLTKRNFWWVFFLNMVIAIVFMTILLSIAFVVFAIFQLTVIGILMMLLLLLMLVPIRALPYAVMYFDLTVRNEAVDLEAMVQAVIPNENNDNTIDLEHTVYDES